AAQRLTKLRVDRGLEDVVARHLRNVGEGRCRRADDERVEPVRPLGVHADEIDHADLLPEDHEREREWSGFRFQFAAVGTRLVGWANERSLRVVAGRAVRVSAEDVTQGAQARDEQLAVPADPAHGLDRHRAGLSVMRLLADGRAESLEVAPDLLTFTVAI